MAMYGQGKTRGQVALLEIEAATTQNAAAIQAGPEINPEFLWLFLLTQYDHLRGTGALGQISHLNLGYLRELSIPKPPLDEQQEIADTLGAIDRRIANLEAKTDLLAELFYALLDELLRGRLRLGVLPDICEHALLNLQRLSHA